MALGWADFEAWNMLPFLPDQFETPYLRHHPHANGSVTIDSTTDPRAQYMLPRCWLEIETIVKRLAKLKLEFADDLRLREVYISTNGMPEWVDKLKEALLQSGWSSVKSTHDLKLTWEESGVDSAIGAQVEILLHAFLTFLSVSSPTDMEMASRGQIFVGNGFSTFSSTMCVVRHLISFLPSLIIFLWLLPRRVSLRLSRGLLAKHIRFW